MSLSSLISPSGAGLSTRIRPEPHPVDFFIWPLNQPEFGNYGMSTEYQRSRLSPSRVFVISFVAALGGMLGAHFGSDRIRQIEARIRGESLILDATSKSFGVVSPGKAGAVSFALKNISNKPVSVIGVNSSCTCTAVAHDLPMRVDSGKTENLVFTVSPTKVAGEKTEDIVIYTDCPYQTEIYLQLRGEFLTE